MDTLIERIKEFLENEAHACSMDFGCVTPLYIYRMWSENVALEDIEAAFKQVKSQM